MMGRQLYAEQTLGVLYGQIKHSRVLLVGAGGIGCELLKNLVLTGFGEVHIVDLDTIDLSNLNRQFLFRREHIKKSKALVARDAAAKFNAAVKLEAHHANIKDPRFNIDWFKGFDIVFNALDNIDARRHVNRMCLAADVPLVESGTTGFKGQVQVIKRGLTECYDCNPKETQKSFPVCTIRTTPSQPIHSIVWAKSYLFPELFGTSEDDSPELDHSEDAQNAGEIEKLRREAQALRRIREARGSPDFPRQVFEKVFSEDIERLRSMGDLWKSRKPPTALDYDALSAQAAGVKTSVARIDQRIWSLEENFVVFSDSLRRLADRIQEIEARTGPADPSAILSFDKDDADTLDFVAASSNLRSIVFSIEPKSKFDIKQMAGNIIPAIATTNAMVAGLCVLQGFKALRGDYNSARMLFLTRSTDRAVSADKLSPPKPDCAVCGVAQSRIEVDTSRATLKDLVDDFLRLELGYGDEFCVRNELGTLYDADLNDNLSKPFAALGITNDSFLTVIDEDEDDPRINLVLSVAAKPLPIDSKPIVAPEKVEIGKRPRAATAAAAHDGVTNGQHANGQQANGTGTIAANGVPTLGKRKREADDVAAAPAAEKAAFGGDMELLRTKRRGRVAEQAANGGGEEDDREEGGKGKEKDRASSPLPLPPAAKKLKPDPDAEIIDLDADADGDTGAITILDDDDE